MRRFVHWCTLGALLLFSNVAYASPLRPCLSDSECSGSMRCVDTLCRSGRDATLSELPSVRVELIFEEKPCWSGLRVGRALRDQMKRLLAAAKIPHNATPRAYGVKDGALDLAMLTYAMDEGHRALVKIETRCAPLDDQSDRVHLRISTVDLATLRSPISLQLKTHGTLESLPVTWPPLMKLVNGLAKLSGAPSGVLGSSIAFTCRTKPGQKEIFSVDIAGRRLRKETNLNSLSMFPAWAPDATIAATSYIGADAMILKNGAVFVNRDGLNTGITFHAKTQKFVVASAQDDAQDLWLGDARSGRLTANLTQTSHIDTSPEFNPDGTHLVFVSDRSGTPQIYVMRLANRSVSRISKIGSYNTAPAWSPDGTTIAWARRASGSRHVIVLSERSQRGRRERVIASGASSYETPSFSPDGRQLVVTEKNEHIERLVQIDLKTQAVRAFDIASMPKRCGHPNWSPVFLP